MNKLVRDQPGLRIRAEGGSIREAAVNEMPALLARKLVEEAAEVLHACEHDLGSIIEEMGDMMEAFTALIVSLGIDPTTVRDAQFEKRAREGSFNHRLVWTPPA